MKAENIKPGIRVKTKHGLGTVIACMSDSKEYLIEHDSWFNGHAGTSGHLWEIKTLDYKISNGWYFSPEELTLVNSLTFNYLIL